MSGYIEHEPRWARRVPVGGGWSDASSIRKRQQGLHHESSSSLRSRGSLNRYRRTRGVRRVASHVIPRCEPPDVMSMRWFNGARRRSRRGWDPTARISQKAAVIPLSPSLLSKKICLELVPLSITASRGPPDINSRRDKRARGVRGTRWRLVRAQSESFPRCYKKLRRAAVQAIRSPRAPAAHLRTKKPRQK